MAHAEEQIRNLTGPVSALLVKTESPTLFREEVANLADKIAMMINQVRLAITFQRQRSVLSALRKSDAEAKEIINDI